MKLPGELPMSEAEFRATLDPVAIVSNRATVGGPQPAEMERMLKAAQQTLAEQDEWIKARRERIASVAGHARQRLRQAAGRRQIERAASQPASTRAR